MAASCFSMATTHKLPPSLESSSVTTAGFGVSSCMKAASVRMAKPRGAASAVAATFSLQLSHILSGFSCLSPVVGSSKRSSRMLRNTTALAEGPMTARVIDEQEIGEQSEDEGYVPDDFSEGDDEVVSESEDETGGFEAVLEDPESETQQWSEGVGEGSYHPPIPEGTKVFVGNISFDIDSEGLARIFEESGVVEMVEVIYNRATGKSRGFAFVTMSTVEEAEAAIQMFNGKEIGGRPLRVNFPEVPRGAGTVPRPRPYFTSQANSQHKVYVGNLSWNITSDTLRSAFEGKGNVVGARVVYDRDTGKSRGFGFVFFASEEDVETAISSMSGVELDGRRIRVNRALENRPRAEY